MKIFLIILLAFSINAQDWEGETPVITKEGYYGWGEATNITEIDTTISEEEQFLKDISDEALAKDERRKKLTNDMLTVAVIYLLIDKFFINK